MVDEVFAYDVHFSGRIYSEVECSPLTDPGAAAFKGPLVRSVPEHGASVRHRSASHATGTGAGCRGHQSTADSRLARRAADFDGGVVLAVFLRLGARHRRLRSLVGKGLAFRIKGS